MQLRHCLTGIVVIASYAAAAQTVPVMNTHPLTYEQRTDAQIAMQSAALLEEARKRPDGLMSLTFEQYPNHLTMLAARSKSGGAELHEHVADFFIILDGEATEIVGGKVENPKQVSTGEIRGTQVVGGVPHLMRKGDVIHIAPNTPHQAVLPENGHVVYYVIKVDEPAPR